MALTTADTVVIEAGSIAAYVAPTITFSIEIDLVSSKVIGVVRYLDGTTPLATGTFSTNGAGLEAIETGAAAAVDLVIDAMQQFLEIELEAINPTKAFTIVP